MSVAPPENGQVVEVRTRQWIVTDVKASSLASHEEVPPQNLVTLTSLDEDALGEALSVIWEIEPGARILEKIGLPEFAGVDDSDRLEAFLDAVRWGAATSANRNQVQAPFRSGIQIEGYQLEPVSRAIGMPRANLLIADDVGLGKTIEAGLVVLEFLIRHRARSVLIVCPASLQVKWRTEMLEKFGLEFAIVDTEYVRQLRRQQGIGANPWIFTSRLITSMDWAKSGEGLRLLKDALPPRPDYPRKFDILIVDEAHNVAPAGGKYLATQSQRTHLIRTLAPHCENRLFLTATPHDGNQYSFTSLLELLDDQRFIRSYMPDSETLRSVMVRRLKSDLPGFPKRVLKALEVPYSDEERSIHALLKEYASSRSETVRRAGGFEGTDFVLTLLKKRLFSSPRAFATTLGKHVQALGKPRVQRRRLMDDRILHRAILKANEDYAKDEEVERVQEEAVTAVSERMVVLTEGERRMLDRLNSWAASAANRPDSKVTAILDWIRANLRTANDWNRNRVILFTEYRTTLSWLHELLASAGFAGDRLAILHGDTDPEDREKIKAAFQTDPEVSRVRILLATDAASEGIDLQNWCHHMIHVEIPWNPNVLEQRNGRIDRHGQRHGEVLIWHPVGKGFNPKLVTSQRPGDLEGDLEYLMRAAIKVEAIREDLGSVGSVIARQVEEAMLGRRDQLDTVTVEAQSAQTKKVLRRDDDGKIRLEKLAAEIRESREGQFLTPERLHRAVRIAMEIAEKPPLTPATLPGIPEGSAFRVPPLTGSWADDFVALNHPHTGVRRPICFDPEKVKNRDDVVLTHMGHRFVQRCLRLLRAQVWAHSGRGKLNRISVRSVPNMLAEHPVAIVWSRLVITGASHARLHEELTLAGAELKEKGFARIDSVSRVDRLIKEAKTVFAPPKVIEMLRKRYEPNLDKVLKIAHDRSEEIRKSNLEALKKRCEGESRDLRKILGELRAMLEAELKKQISFVQGQLFGDSEQVKKDRRALDVRLRRIPEEVKQEIEAIERRYADLRVLTFPVAVEFLVPESLLAAK